MLAVLGSSTPPHPQLPAEAPMESPVPEASLPAPLPEDSLLVGQQQPLALQILDNFLDMEDSRKKRGKKQHLVAEIAEEASRPLTERHSDGAASGSQSAMAADNPVGGGTDS